MLQSDPVIAGSLEFVAQAPADWKIPRRGEPATPVPLELRIRNIGGARSGPISVCLLDTIRVRIARPGMPPLLVDGGRNALRPGPSSSRVEPGAVLPVSWAARLEWPASSSGPRLISADLFGGVWYVDGLSAGVWTFGMEYDSTRAPSSCWQGKATTAPLVLHLQ